VNERWFVVNARDAQWNHAEGRSAYCSFSKEAGERFPQLGFNINVMEPGDVGAMYHWEADQEDFLMLAGEALLIVEGEERPLHAWDFVHCPAGTPHAIVNTGDAMCAFVAVGARDRSTGPDWGAYVADDAAARHGVGVAEDTSDPALAYGPFPGRNPTPYRAGWLP